MISAVPNMPIATTTKPMPSDSSGMPKVKRSTPELTSVPIRPSSRPNTTMAIALMSEPCASTVAATRPSTISEKYSAGPNLSATSASGGARDRDHQRGHAAGEERADRGDGERRARHGPAAPSGSRPGRSPPRTTRPGC